MAFSITRRGLVAGGCAFASMFVVGGAAFALDGDEGPLRPPGAQDEEHFRETCLKCNRCESICPQGCIRTGTLEDGLLNWRTPIMDFQRGICDFCGKCEDVCPTNAIAGVDEATSVIGLAVVDEERCLAYVSGACRVCADECPYDAIAINDNGHPVVDADVCNGCGVCEYECPSNTYRSFAGGTRRGINIELAEA